MQYFIDHYLVGVIFMIIAIYSGYEIWKIRKQKNEKAEERIPAPPVHVGEPEGEDGEEQL